MKLMSVFRRTVVCLLFTLVGVSCADPKANTLRDPMFDAHAEERGKALVSKGQADESVEWVWLGDSHFEFLPDDFLSVASVNLGIRGDTVYAVLSRMSTYPILDHVPNVAISLGTNNVANGVKPTTTLDQLETLVSRFDSSQTVYIALLNPLSEQKGFRDFNRRLLDLNNRIEKKFAEVANVVLVPAMADPTKKPYRMTDDHYGQDGIHFSELGYQRWQQRWLSVLR